MRASLRRVALAGCLGLLALSSPPVAPASAATYGVSMTGSATFSPSGLTLALGSSVRWTNTASGSNHTATSNQNFFNTGYLAPGQSATRVFPFAGAFAYHCIPHRHMGMTGMVAIRISAPSSDPDRFRVRWATDTASLTNRTFDVHRKPPGGVWTVWQMNTKSRYFDTWPTKNGTWQYRVRTDIFTNGLSLTSGWSPIKYVKVY